MQVLLIDPASRYPADGLADSLAEGGWRLTVLPDYRSALIRTRRGEVDALVLPTPTDGLRCAGGAELMDLIRAADAQRVATIVLADTAADLPLDSSLVDVLPPKTTGRELRYRLATLQRYQTVVRRVERELDNAELMSRRLNRHFSEMEQEMRLAGRLQRDFLPQVADPLGPLCFSTVFRPASWVSGDIYDFFRVDERHVAFYIADAVGHGMAAGLLTMFIKKAVVSKRTHDNHHEVLGPAETMQGLNDALAAQDLPQCQFVTACYCLVNTETLEMQYARGGHPYPLLVSAGGGPTEIKSIGGLMGLFAGAEFTGDKVQLKPGDKVILYTDGLETAYSASDNPDGNGGRHLRVFEDLAGLPVNEMTERINSLLDAQAGSLNPVDDVTIVAMEVQDQAGAGPA